MNPEDVGRARKVPSVVLFDFFGTLVEYSASRTEQGYERSFAVLEEAGCSLGYNDFLQLWSSLSERLDTEARSTLREFSMAELGLAFFEKAVPGKASAAHRARFLETYLEEWNQGVRPIPGLVDMLTRLATRFRLAVITNTHDARLVPRHLERLGMARCFEAVFTSVEFGLRKPHPAIFEHAMRSLVTSPGECLYVGDDEVADFDGAAGAGLPALLVDPLGVSSVAPSAQLSSILELESRLAGGGD